MPSCAPDIVVRPPPPPHCARWLRRFGADVRRRLYTVRHTGRARSLLLNEIWAAVGPAAAVGSAVAVGAAAGTMSPSASRESTPGPTADRDSAAIRPPQPPWRRAKASKPARRQQKSSSSGQRLPSSAPVAQTRRVHVSRCGTSFALCFLSYRERCRWADVSPHRARVRCGRTVLDSCFAALRHRGHLGVSQSECWRMMWCAFLLFRAVFGRSPQSLPHDAC